MDGRPILSPCTHSVSSCHRHSRAGTLSCQKCQAVTLPPISTVTGGTKLCLTTRKGGGHLNMPRTCMHKFFQPVLPIMQPRTGALGSSKHHLHPTRDLCGRSRAGTLHLAMRLRHIPSRAGMLGHSQTLIVPVQVLFQHAWQCHSDVFSIRQSPGRPFGAWSAPTRIC